jgi:hypothetical protein
MFAVNEHANENQRLKKYVYSKSEYSTFFLLPIPAEISKDGKEDYPPV